MIRGTTPFFTLAIDGYDLTDKTVYVTIAQNNVKIIKTGDDLQVTYAEGLTGIVVMLTQRDTLKLKKGRAYVEVKFIDSGGIVYATNTKRIDVVENTLLGKIIEFRG